MHHLGLILFQWVTAISGLSCARGNTIVYVEWIACHKRPYYHDGKRTSIFILKYLSQYFQKFTIFTISEQNVQRETLRTETKYKYAQWSEWFRLWYNRFMAIIQTNLRFLRCSRTNTTSNANIFWTVTKHANKAEKCFRVEVL